jgi:hypothetical protein
MIETSAECEGEQARAEQDKTRNGYREESVGGEFITHATTFPDHPAHWPRVTSHLWPEAACFRISVTCFSAAR